MPQAALGGGGVGKEAGWTGRGGVGLGGCEVRKRVQFRNRMNSNGFRTLNGFDAESCGQSWGYHYE